ncbi:MAG: geranylgeranyl diphosphate synthase, type [Candidatus Atribacteria bacterium]|nr:geranylgeranyl diphosphate synthase, type [Candidatus Atribacteria bacterium]
MIQYLEQNAKLVDSYLEEKLTWEKAPSILVEAIKYGTLGGGKKVRSSLLFATGNAFGIERKELLPLAGTLEMVHSFSLIHDDLPCMDNDDFRRGKPSLHKAFGEALAVLAGDALLVEGISLTIRDANFLSHFGSEKILQSIQILLEALGVEGMVGGQVLDIEGEGKKVSQEQILEIYRLKTACLIRAAILCGAILGNASSQEQERLDKFGWLIGECFQLKDDILDLTGESEQLGKTIGKDLLQDKATLIKVKGLDSAQAILKEKFTQAKSLLPDEDRYQLLLGLAKFIVERER